MTPPPSETITPEEWQQTPASVRSWIGELLAEVKQLRETVEQLQAIVNRNSQNSSQPPSQDRPDLIPTRELSGPPRQRGGQPGHRGHHRALVDAVDEVVVHKPTCCAGGGALLLGEDDPPLETWDITPKSLNHCPQAPKRMVPKGSERARDD